MYFVLQDCYDKLLQNINIFNIKLITSMNDENEEKPLTPSKAGKFGLSAKKKKKLQRILLIVAPIVLTIVAAIFFFFFVIKGPNPPEEDEVKQPKEKEHVQLDSNTYLDVDPITVGLSLVLEQKGNI